ncbi:MAG: hypothetical protein KME46_10660 [Brasilonema angustatum HA4187-MV1]|nr:hypothetical protein [Brasilonema angustatum HA4187-MV1]
MRRKVPWAVKPVLQEDFQRQMLHLGSQCVGGVPPLEAPGVKPQDRTGSSAGDWRSRKVSRQSRTCPPLAVLIAFAQRPS